LKIAIKTRNANPNKNKNNNSQLPEMRFEQFWFYLTQTNKAQKLWAEKLQKLAS